MDRKNQPLLNLAWSSLRRIDLASVYYEWIKLRNKSGSGLFDGGLGPCDGYVWGSGGRLRAGGRFGPDVIDGELGPDGAGQAERKR
jgi:hypothetical protein